MFYGSCFLSANLLEHFLPGQRACIHRDCELSVAVPVELVTAHSTRQDLFVIVAYVDLTEAHQTGPVATRPHPLIFAI